MRKHFKHYAAPAAVIAMSTALAGCDLDINFGDSVEGVPYTELEIPAEAPSSLELVGPDDMVITTGEVFTVTLEGPQDVQDAMRFDLDGKELTIGRDNKAYDGGDTVKIRITMPAPARLEMTGAGSITADTMAANAKANVNGSGDITIANLNADSFEGEVNGSADLTASGTATQLKVEVNGSGDAHLEGLMAENAEAEINGSGDIAFASDGSVDAEINGSGDIVVTGSASCSSDINGSGSLRCKPAADVAPNPAIADESATEVGDNAE